MRPRRDTRSDPPSRTAVGTVGVTVGTVGVTVGTVGATVDTPRKPADSDGIGTTEATAENGQRQRLSGEQP